MKVISWQMVRSLEKAASFKNCTHKVSLFLLAHRLYCPEQRNGGYGSWVNASRKHFERVHLDCLQ